MLYIKTLLAYMFCTEYFCTHTVSRKQELTPTRTYFQVWYLWSLVEDLPSHLWLSCSMDQSIEVQRNDRYQTHGGTIGDYYKIDFAEYCWNQLENRVGEGEEGCGSHFPYSVTKWETFATLPPLPPPPTLPTLLASCEIAESQPNEIFCHRLQRCQLLAEIVSQSGTKFSATGEKVCLLNNFKLHGSFLSENRTFCAKLSEKTCLILFAPFGQLPTFTFSPIPFPATSCCTQSIYLQIVENYYAVVCRNKLYKDDITLVSQFLHAYAGE